MTITIGLGAALGILGIHSIMDIRRKEINVILAGACLAAGVAWQFFGQKTETAEILLSCLPGSVLLGTAYLTEQKIGYGDGWVVMGARQSSPCFSLSLSFTWAESAAVG